MDRKKKTLFSVTFSSPKRSSVSVGMEKASFRSKESRFSKSSARGGAGGSSGVALDLSRCGNKTHEFQNLKCYAHTLSSLPTAPH